MTSEWKPIETAPKDGTEVLTYREAGLIAVASFIMTPKGPFWCVSDGAEIINVTHWMPLPEPPIKEQKK